MTARRAFAHSAVLALQPDADRRAPGGAVTLALCGSWKHEPPCPLAPHRTTVEGNDGALAVRVFFATASENEPGVRRRIEAALAAGGTTGPDGVVSRWRLVETAPDAVRDEEREAAERLSGQSPD